MMRNFMNPSLQHLIEPGSVLSRRVCLAILIGLVWQARFCPAAEPVQTWEIEGVERQGLVFAPDSAKTEPAPLIFAFHGHGGTMHNSSRAWRYQELWPEAIVIYLQGLNTPGRLTDPQGKKPGWQSKVGDQNDRDLKLFDAVLKWARQTYKVDDKRVYCTGHSNGGGFTYLLWAARGDAFAAVAPSSAAGLGVLKDLKPKPMLHIGGLKDPLVKFEWQKTTIDAVRKINGCDPEGKSEGDRLTVYPSPTGTVVETYLYDGGHSPPADAWPQVVKFFKEHPAK
jgi:polyhydroxybutyrate depolymerase